MILPPLVPQSNHSIGKKVCEVYDTNSLVKKSLSLKFIASVEVCNMARCSCPHPHEKDVSILKSIFFRALCVRLWFGGVWGGLGCFNGPHDGYANRSNSQTSLPRGIGSPTDSRTVLPRAVC